MARMILHAADLLPPMEDDFVDPATAVRPPPVARRPARRRRFTVEALAWAALEVLAFGPLIGYLLATLF